MSPSDFEYFKLDATHPDYLATIATLRAQMMAMFPDNDLSINLKKDDSMAWVKALIGSGVSGPVVLAIAMYDDRSPIYADTNSPDWADPPPFPTPIPP